jgi:hypothetical protein
MIGRHHLFVSTRALRSDMAIAHLSFGAGPASTNVF